VAAFVNSDIAISAWEHMVDDDSSLDPQTPILPQESP